MAEEAAPALPREVSTFDVQLGFALGSDLLGQNLEQTRLDWLCSPKSQDGTSITLHIPERRDFLLLLLSPICFIAIARVCAGCTIIMVWYRVLDHDDDADTSAGANADTDTNADAEASTDTKRCAASAPRLRRVRATAPAPELWPRWWTRPPPVDLVLGCTVHRSITARHI